MSKGKQWEGGKIACNNMRKSVFIGFLKGLKALNTLRKTDRTSKWLNSNLMFLNCLNFNVDHNNKQMTQHGDTHKKLISMTIKFYKLIISF